MALLVTGVIEGGAVVDKVLKERKLAIDKVDLLNTGVSATILVLIAVLLLVMLALFTVMMWL